LTVILTTFVRHLGAEEHLGLGRLLGVFRRLVATGSSYSEQAGKREQVFHDVALFHLGLL
jgi:hypothetical protein